MSDVTHAKCPRCNSFQPVVWRHVKIAQFGGDGNGGEFTGMACHCRECDFEIALLGSVRSIDLVES